MLSRFSRKLTSSVRLTREQVRNSSGIKLFGEKEKAAEDYYFSKQDGMVANVIFLHYSLEKLIKHMIQDSPDEVGLTTGQVAGEPETCSDKIKLIFMKNGIPPNAHPQLLDDLVHLLESESRK